MPFYSESDRGDTSRSGEGEEHTQIVDEEEEEESEEEEEESEEDEETTIESGN